MTMQLNPDQLKQAREWILGAFGHPEVWDRDVIPTMTDTQIELAITRHYDGGIPGFIRSYTPITMTETKTAYTPGPWTTNVEAGYPIPIYRPACADGSGAIHVCGVGGNGFCPESTEENEANARLIAAAPELLEACKTLVAADKHPRRSMEFDCVIEHAWEQARAAVAKVADE